MDFTKRKTRVTEAVNKQQNPRIKSIRLSGSRLAVRIATQAKASNSLEELCKLSIAQSTVSTAMTIVEEDFQRANKLLDMARSIANTNTSPEEKKDTENG